MLRRLLPLVAVVVFLAVPAGAQAAPFTPQLNVAYRVAVEYWGAEPVNCLSLDLQIVPMGSLSEYNEGEPASAVATLATTAQPCSLWVERQLAAPAVFGAACSAIVHEVGHLLGYGHSDDPASVMNPDGHSVPRCEKLGRFATVMGPGGGNFPPKARERAARRFWAPLRG